MNPPRPVHRVPSYVLAAVIVFVVAPPAPLCAERLDDPPWTNALTTAGARTYATADAAAAPSGTTENAWIVGGGIGFAATDLSIRNEEDTWGGFSVDVFLGRDISGHVQLALDIGLQNLTVMDLFDTSDEISLLTVALSAYLGQRAYLRGDVGYTRATSIGTVGDEFNPVTRRLERFDGGKDAIYLLGGLGADLELDDTLALRPQATVVYHQFDGWYIVGGRVELHLRVRL